MEQLLNKPCIEAKFASFVSCAEMLGQMLYMITIVINDLVDHFRDDLNFCFAMSASNGEDSIIWTKIHEKSTWIMLQPPRLLRRADGNASYFSIV